MPLITVVIPTFNRADQVKRSIQSVINQTFTDFELLVMDDGSTDHTQEIVSAFKDSRIHYETAENSGGPATPRNRGIKLSRTEYIAFLDSDDWWLPEKLEESYKHLKGGADIVYHDLWIVREKGARPWRKSKGRHYKFPVQLNLLIYGNFIPNSSVVVRKSLLDAIGGIDQDKEIIGCEDYDAWLRISAITEHFSYIPDCLGYYWAGEGTISDEDMIAPNTKVVKQTLNALEKFSEKEMIAARSKLNFYDAVNFISMGSYRAARSALRPVIGIRWEYLVIYLILFLPVPKAWLLRVLNR